MKKWTVRTLAFWITWLGIALPLFGATAKLHQIGEGVRTEQLRSTQVTGELVASASVGQIVRAEWDGLAGVAVRLGTYGRRNTGSLVFHLQAFPEAGSDLATIRVDSSDIQDNAFYLFRFRPIFPSRNRIFYFYLEAPDGRAGNAITVWGSPEDVYPDGWAVIHGLPDPNMRDLAFWLLYEPPTAIGWQVFLDQLSSSKPLFFGDKWFYIAILLIQFSLMYCLLFYTIRDEDG